MSSYFHEGPVGTGSDKENAPLLSEDVEMAECHNNPEHVSSVAATSKPLKHQRRAGSSSKMEDIRSALTVHVKRQEFNEHRQRLDLDKLPKYLPHPPLKGIPPSALSERYSALEGVPIPYVVDKLVEMGEELYESIKNANPSGDDLYLPSTEGTSAEPSFTNPTLILALHPTHKSSCIAACLPRTFLQPTHDLVLASQCSNITIPATSDNQPQTIPLRIPSPELFAPLHHYLFTHNSEELLLSLLPTIRDNAPVLQQKTNLATSVGLLATQVGDFITLYPVIKMSATIYAESLATASPLKGLVFCATRLIAFWSNVHALGIHDKYLWMTLDIAWRVIHSAIRLKRELIAAT